MGKYLILLVLLLLPFTGCAMPVSAEVKTYEQEYREALNRNALLEQEVELYKNKPPVTVVEIVTVNNTIETIKEVPVETPVYINNEWREWKSLAELTGWVEEHETSLLFIGDSEVDCDDFATRMQREAYKDGYFLSVQLIENGILNNYRVFDYPELHMGNFAIVSNNMYYIEPQGQHFRIVFVGYRD